MKPVPDCVPEILESVLQCARMVSDDPFIPRKVLTKVMSDLVETNDFQVNPAELTFRCITTAYKALGVKDPFEKDKARCLKAMLGLEKNFRELLDVAPDRLQAALNLVLAGYGADISALGREEMERTILEQFDHPVARDDREQLIKAIQHGGSVMYILDTVSNLVLDKLLIEELAKHAQVTVVAANVPILAAATVLDTTSCEFPDSITVTDPGAPMLGLMPDRASNAFREQFLATGTVIAKGETAYETLAHGERDAFFILRADCPSVAERLAIQPGDLALTFVARQQKKKNSRRLEAVRSEAGAAGKKSD